jgi:hypothetical protein
MLNSYVIRRLQGYTSSPSGVSVLIDVGTCHT